MEQIILLQKFPSAEEGTLIRTENDSAQMNFSFQKWAFLKKKMNVQGNWNKLMSEENVTIKRKVLDKYMERNL